MSFSEVIRGRLFQADASASSWAAIDELRQPSLVIDLHGSGGPPLSCVVYLRWAIEDGPLPDRGVLSAVERLGVNFIQAGGVVVTMCNLGLNRSGLVSALIVSRLESMTGAEALRYVRYKVPEAVRNPAFAAYLEHER
jgi:hypothetical protein